MTAAQVWLPVAWIKAGLLLQNTTNYTTIDLAGNGELYRLRYAGVRLVESGVDLQSQELGGEGTRRMFAESDREVIFISREK